MPTEEPHHIAELLLGWFAQNRRSLPWRDETDAYAVLVSEIMLQQTQVDRVVPLYRSFLRNFPTPAVLAAASRADVLTAWRGLGYNRRAVALHEAARVIAAEHGGKVPAALDALLALPGVGGYTARAVRAFAFGCDEAPVDTNIRRVLTRAVQGAPLAPRRVQEIADEMVPRGRGRDWSAAVMDLGATVCTARNPRCAACPLQALCAFAATGGDDPAAAPVRHRAPQPFIGSDRFHRGRLLDALRSGPVTSEALTDAASLNDGGRAVAVANALVDDGLAEWDGAVLRLPA